MTTLIITIPANIAPDDRLSLKDAVGDAVRNTLNRDIAVSIDHIGLPIDPQQLDD